MRMFGTGALVPNPKKALAGYVRLKTGRRSGGRRLRKREDAPSIGILTHNGINKERYSYDRKSTD